MAADGTRTLHFTDVTRASGIDARGYGMGVAAGDFDNDGWVDVYLTKFDAPNQLFRNNGDGTFTDVSAERHRRARSWSVSASFVDVDRDGWLDLFVGNYLRLRLQSNTRCFGASGRPDYCTPDSYRRTARPPVPQSRRRHIRRRQRAAAARAASSGRRSASRQPTSTATAGSTSTSANDGQENQLWLNQRNGTFGNAALLAGAALPADGKAEASMGVDAGDFDNDGDEDLIVTELTGERQQAVRQRRHRDCSKIAARRPGIGPRQPAVHRLWNGLVRFRQRRPARSARGQRNGVRSSSAEAGGDPFPLHQRKLLFRNVGGGRFEDVSDTRGRGFSCPRSGRGAAFGDIDNDGDMDVVVGNNNGPRAAADQSGGSRSHWVGLRLAGERAGATCWARGSRSSGRAARRCGAAPEPTGAMPRRTIRASWSASAIRPPHPA